MCAHGAELGLVGNTNSVTHGLNEFAVKQSRLRNLGCQALASTTLNLIVVGIIM